MNLINNIINPSYSRKPCFVSGKENLPYTWKCSKCLHENQLTFEELSDLYWGGSGDISKEDTAVIKEFYRIGYVNKSHDGGWPHYKLISCSNCNESFLLYVGITERPNSCLNITIQAITEIKNV